VTIERLADFLANTNPGFFILFAALFVPFARDVASRSILMVGGPLVALVALISAQGLSIDLQTVQFLGLELVLYRPDSLSFVFGLAFIIAAALVGVYALHRRDALQDSTAMLYAGAAVTAVFVGDLISLFIAWELTAIASVFQILAPRAPESVRAAVRYLVFQVGSGMLVLAGICLYVSSGGDTQFSLIATTLTGLPVGVMDINAPGAVFILAGFGIKAAFPMVHNWLQDAYPRASETGSVVLSAFTTKLAVYALARYFAGLEALIWIGAIMAVFPVFFAVIENDLRKVLSYSLNNQVGFMVCAVGIGTQLAVNGAAAHAFTHIMYKALLFMSMGAVLLRTGTTKASELGGLHRTMPWTTLCCLVGAASISALPLFSGFVAKSMVMSASHADPALFMVWLMLLFASAGVLEHSGIKIPYFAFFSHDSGKRPQEAPFNMLFAMGAAAALCILIGTSPAWLYQFLPYQDVAMAYLATELWTPAHVLQQLQLLVFATLAFMLLQWRRWYPAEQPGLIIDAEWLWRRGWPMLARGVGRPARRFGRFVSGLAGATGGSLQTASQQIFGAEGWVAAKVPLSATAVLSLGILGVVLLVSLFS
jgi:multicomponent Na+:H+ antiporter subunit D